ncbi:MAG: hypothetical protein U9N84_12980 [Actinomycetota bacterium]|nr:hypothetical protein [Actinomycetota bacterium]
MKGVARLALVVAASALVVTGCGDGSQHRDGARTYYESLDLSSPAAAVETFADAFARDDFMAVWLSFGRHAQTRLTQALNLLQYGEIVGPEAMDDLRAWLQNDIWFENMEYPDEWWLFDQIMLIADGNDGFIIDLSGDLMIKNEELGSGTAVVIAEVAGIAGDVEFDLRESATGRWQIEIVAAPGAERGPAIWPLELGD